MDVYKLEISLTLVIFTLISKNVEDSKNNEPGTASFMSPSAIKPD
jgi:hypothetical protein